MMNKLLLQKILSESEFCSIDYNGNNSDDYYFECLIKLGIIGVFDWKHSDERDLHSFIDERLMSIASLGLELLGLSPFTATKLYESFYPNRNVDYMQFLLRFYNKKIKEKGFRLLSINRIDRQDDCYYIIIASSSNAQKLKRIKSNYWTFKEIK